MRLSQLHNTIKLSQLVFITKNLIAYTDGTIKERKEDDYFKNKELLKWLKSHGINFVGVPESAEGSSGVVYFFKDKVLKISHDRTESIIANKLKGDSIVSVVDVMKIDDNTWGILQDKVNFNNRHPVVVGLDVLMAYFDNHGKDVINEPTEDIVKGMRKEFPQYVDGADLETAVNMIKYVKNKTGYIHDDAAPSNVGILNGNAVFTDLGPNIVND